MYKCKHFAIYELVPPDIYESYEEWKLWNLFDPTGLEVIDLLRDKYGAFLINDYQWGWDHTQSGLRTEKSKYYSFTSLHSWARAFDKRPQDTPLEKIRQDISDRKFKFMEKIKGLELGVSWLHIDFRNSDSLISFRPN